MKFVHSREIKVPVEYLFDRASDFAAFERRGAKHALEVHRLTGGPVVVGCRWQIAGVYRNKPRQADVELTELTPPDRISIRADSAGYQGSGVFNFIALTKRTSRIETVIVAKATTLRTRLLLQTLRLVRGRIARRIKSAINLAARKAEEDYRAASR